MASQATPTGSASSASGASGENAAGPAAAEAASFDPVERVLLAQLHFADAAWQEGLALVEHSSLEAQGLRLIEARGHFGKGDRARALLILERMLAERPSDVLALYYKAQFLAQSGQPREATLVLSELIERMPDFPGGLKLLGSLVFPGPPYRELLARLHEVLRPRTYLEIGVEHGTTLALAVHSRHAVGVDPVARPPTRALPAGARLFHMTSDAFFEAHSPDDVLAGERVALAFIDGMHSFEYALRDFCNVERWCGPGSTVVMHDCLPPHAVAAARERQSHFWVGDTWKALECLLELRPDLRIDVVPCYPSGLVVIQKLDPASTVLPPQLGTLSERFMGLPYPYAPGAFPSHYPIVANAEPALGRLLASLRS